MGYNSKANGFRISYQHRKARNPMSKITLINASCADQTVDAVVNAANSGLWAAVVSAV